MRRGGGEIPRKTNNIDSRERKKNHLFRFPSSRVFTVAREKTRSRCFAAADAKIRETD